MPKQPEICIKVAAYPPTVAFMLAMLLAGCTDSNRSKIIGIWEIESADRVTDRFKDTELNSSTNDERPHDESRMRVVFQADGILKTNTAMGAITGYKEGYWELVSVDESNSKIRLKCKLGLQETEHEIEILGPDTIKMVPPNMAGVDMKIRFNRKSQ